MEEKPGEKSMFVKEKVADCKVRCSTTTTIEKQKYLKNEKKGELCLRT
jgi:hypothetical protein